MNILEQTANTNTDLSKRRCSNVSTSTKSSTKSNNTPNQILKCITDHEHLEDNSISSMSQQKQPSQIDISKYLIKRKNVMNWLQRYGSQLNLSRNAVSASQQYADIYYHNTQYDQKIAKIILTSLLILASKYCDHKILFTNKIAYICDLDIKQLNYVELQCCCILQFGLTCETYVMIIDGFIDKIKRQLGIDLYVEQQQNYVLLRVIHRVVQQIYSQNYQWQTNQFDILQVFIQVFHNLQYKNNHIINYLTKEQKQYFNNIFLVQYNKIKTNIINYIQQYRQIKQKDIRNLFKNRSKQTNYPQFVSKYYQ